MMVENESYDDLISGSTVDVGIVRGDRLSLIKAARVSGYMFIELFLHEHLHLEIPDVHRDVWGRLTDESKLRVLLAIPRDHAKTTLAKLAVVWYFVYTTHRFCAYLSNTNPIAKNACRDILAYMESPNFSLFGSIRMVKSSDNEAFWIFDLTLWDGTVKRCMLRGVGTNQQIRGLNVDNERPDIAVIDDAEDNDTTGSKAQQDKMTRWIYGPFLKALQRKCKILWLGNMLTNTCLLAINSKDSSWNPMVYGAIVHDVESNSYQPLWPGKWTLEELIADFIEYRARGLTETWLCEMMNMPGFSEDGFSAGSIRYTAVGAPEDYKATWITIDPAFGLNAWNDESAIALHGLKTGSDRPETILTRHGKWSETQLFEQTYSLANEWGARVWGIESVAAQRLLIPLFGMFLAQRTVGHYELVPLIYGSNDSKLGRIRGLVNLMVDGNWAINDQDIDFTFQLLHINPRLRDNTDDICDAVASGPILWQQAESIIRSSAMALDLSDGTVLQGMEVCNV